MIHFILASHSEAKPLIEYYKLKKILKLKEFNIFIDNNNQISLTISGLGKVASACSVIYTYSYFKKKNSIWLNIGICGHINENVGEIILVNKITDKSTKKNFYPSIVFNHDYKMLNCITNDMPNFNYKESIYEMELSGFYFAASKVSINELIHSLKIISDNKRSKIDFNKKNEISSLVKKHISNINSLIKKLKNLVIEINVEKPSKLYEEIIKQKHCTNFQKSELKRLIKNLDFLKDIEIRKLIKNNYSAEQCIFAFKNKIKNFKYD